MSQNSERPSGGRIIGIYFAAEELEKLKELQAKLGLKRNTVVRQLVREA